MLTFRLFRTIIRIDFGFFAVVALMLLISDENMVYMCFASCLLHESGHLAAMKICGCDVKYVELYGAGIKIVPNISNCTRTGEALILCSGCAVNFILFLVVSTFGGEDASLFSAINLALMLFNLIPVGCFDGGQLFLLISEGTAYERTVQFFTMVIMPIVISLCAVVAFFVFDVGITAVFTTFFFLVTSFLREFG